MNIPEETIEQVRDAADIVTLISEEVPLKRTGSDYRGACPFHGGANRNLAVIPRKQMFYCFVCHEGGDIFTFYMKKLGMDYPSAVRDVARRVGIEIPDRPTGGPDRREPLYSAVGVAAEWYSARLRDGADAAEARAYIKGRGLDLEVIGPLGLGFAPKGNAFLDGMHAVGLTDEVMFEAGLLVKRDDGSLRPRFWGRLLFPIQDLRGRVVGFGGRVIGEGEPKYLNSPDSEVFHKGKLLYNLHDAKHAIRKAERAILVEGYFDVLRLVETGVENVVAPLGTGLTQDQAALLKRFTTQVTLLYDSDAPGLRATFRTADEFLRAGMRVTVATLPPGEDPDTLAVKGGRKAVDHVLHDAMDVCERKLQLLERKGWMADLSGRRRALDRLLTTLRAASDPVTRDLYVSRVAEALGVSRQSVEREMGSGRDASRVTRHASPDTRPPSRGTRPPSPVTGRGGPEFQLIRVLVHAPEWRTRIAEQLKSVRVLPSVEAELMTVLSRLPESVKAGDLLAALDAEQRIIVAALLEAPLGSVDIDAIVAGAIDQMKSREVEQEIAELQQNVLVASPGDKEKMLQQINVLSQKRRELNSSSWNFSREGGRVGS